MSSENNKKIFSVTELTHQIHETLDSNFSFFWVSGEISNFASPSSGHFYFSLKDSKAVISAVIFKNQRKNLKFLPENGMEITGFGRISVYPPRGTYQIIFEYLEPKGTGSLQMMFEQTKEKLRSEGLFDEKHKKELPFLPSKIALVTSPTGAALQDMLKIIYNRYSNMEIQLYPVSVQGDNASGELIEAIEDINLSGECDIIIVARGGGSFEDLMPFNSQELAFAVFNSEIPVVSGVGHETDFTIIDFVSDLRAPTPTAAAEYCVPEKEDLINTLKYYENRLSISINNIFRNKKTILGNYVKMLKDPLKEIYDLRIYIDEKSSALERRLKRFLKVKREKTAFLEKNIAIKRLEQFYSEKKGIFLRSESELGKNFSGLLVRKKHEFEKSFTRLFELGPYTVLNRGYSITRNSDSKKILRSVKTDVNKGDNLEVIVSDGIILCNVNEIKED